MLIKTNIPAPIFQWASWWLSDDIFTGLENSFYSWYNINIRWNAKSISLNKALVKDSWTVITEKINEIIKVWAAEFLAFWNSWWIYRKRSWTWVKVTTDSPANPILSAIEFNGYIYRTTAWYLHRLLKTNISDDISATDVINRQALNSVSYHPLLVRTWTLYVWNWKSVDTVDIGNVFQTGIVVESNAVVKFLDKLGSTIKITMQIDLWWYNMYLWNWVTDTPDQSLPIYWIELKQSKIYNWLHFFSTNVWLWALDWYRIYPVKNIETFNDNINSISVFNDYLLVWWTWGVYSYGSKNKNYPPALNLERRTSNNNAADVVWAIFSDWTDLYVSWSNWATYGIDKLSTTVYCTSWELVTRWYYADEFHKIKEAIIASIWWKPLITWQTITISYSVDWWAYNQLVQFTSTSDNKRTYSEDIFVESEFQYIQFKVVFVWPWTSTPELYNIQLLFNNDIQR